MIGFDNIEFASRTDVGVRRSHNQDCLTVLPAQDLEQWLGRGHVFLVADGMGAHAVGELASKLAADNIPHIYSKYAQEGPVPALRKAFIESNLSIHTRGQQNREFEGMGTTSTMLLLRPEGAWVGHVGDSRVYRVRNGKIEQLSFDHSLLWELAKRQKKDPDQLQGVPSNVIVRSLGPEPLVQVDVEGPHPLESGDTFVLCSDGLSGPVTDREIGAVVSALPPEEACRFLIELANLQGGPDNITAIVVRVGPDNGQTMIDLPGSMGESVEQDLRLGLPPQRSRVLRFPRRSSWPLVALLAGIMLAVGATILAYTNQPGSEPAFALAALTLVFGLVGLIFQLAHEKKRQEDSPQGSGAPKVYRSHPCIIDETLVKRIAQAVAELQERLRDHQWSADWDGYRRHQHQADLWMRQENWLEAFRSNSRAMLLLMEAVGKQRAREEVFKPLWDRVRE